MIHIQNSPFLAILERIADTFQPVFYVATIIIIYTVHQKMIFILVKYYGVPYYTLSDILNWAGVCLLDCGVWLTLCHIHILLTPLQLCVCLYGNTKLLHCRFQYYFYACFTANGFSPLGSFIVTLGSADINQHVC